MAKFYETANLHLYQLWGKWPLVTCMRKQKTQRHKLSSARGFVSRKNSCEWNSKGYFLDCVDWEFKQLRCVFALMLACRVMCHERLKKQTYASPRVCATSLFIVKINWTNHSLRIRLLHLKIFCQVC